MAVAFVARASGSATGGGDPVVNVPAGTTSGQNQIMLAWGAVTGAQTITAHADWTTHPESIGTSNPLFYRIVTGTEPASYTFVTSGSANCVVTIATYSGVNTSNPFAGTAGRVSTASTTVTISAANPLVPAYLAQVLAKMTVATWTPPASASPEDWDAAIGAVGSTAGGHETVAAGSTGTRVWLASVGAGAGVGYAVPLRAAIQTLAVTGFDVAVSFGTPTLAQEQIVSPAGFDVAVEYGTPTLVPDQAVSPAGFDVAVEYGTPSLIQGQQIAAPGFDVAVEYGSPSLLQHVAPSGFDANVEFGSPALIQGQIIEPDGFDVAVEFGVPALVSDQKVEPAGFDLAVEFGEPDLLQGQVVDPDGFDLLVEFGTPGLLQNVSAAGYDLVVEFGEPTLAFDASVSPAGFDLAVEFGVPTVTLQPVVAGTVFDHETGLDVGAGVEVKLFDDNDVLVDTTLTDANGAFVFARPFGDTDLYWTLATYNIGPVQYHGVSDRGCPAA